MFNPPIIKPKGYAYGGPIGIGVGNIVEDTLVTDPIIERSNANEIQKDLESLSNDLKKVALIASNGEDDVANLIVDAIDAAGVDGHVIVEEAKGFKSSLTVVEGYQLERGLL